MSFQKKKAYPSKWYTKKMRENQDLFDYFSRFDTNAIDYDGPTFEIVAQTSLMVNIFYESAKYTLISQKPSLTFDGLLAALGGHMGLFIGASVLSLVELVEIILTLILICFRYRS